MEMGTAVLVIDLGSMKNEGCKRRDKRSRNQTLITRPRPLDVLLRSNHIQRKAVRTSHPDTDLRLSVTSSTNFAHRVSGDLGVMELRSGEDGTVMQ